MTHILGWMLAVNQTLTPVENFTVILALCRGKDMPPGAWLTKIKGLLYVPNEKWQLPICISIMEL